LTDHEHDEPEASRRIRRPYRSPRIEESAEFETLALSCNKTPGDNPLCDTDPHFS